MFESHFLYFNICKLQGHLDVFILLPSIVEVHMSEKCITTFTAYLVVFFWGGYNSHYLEYKVTVYLLRVLHLLRYVCGLKLHIL